LYDSEIKVQMEPYEFLLSNIFFRAHPHLYQILHVVSLVFVPGICMNTSRMYTANIFHF
jgi:hypothetical protein